MDLKAFPDGIYGVKFKTSVLCTTVYGYSNQFRKKWNGEDAG